MVRVHCLKNEPFPCPSNQAADEQRQQMKEGEELQRQTEEDADREILDLKNHYELQLRQRLEENTKLRGEVGILSKKASGSVSLSVCLSVCLYICRFVCLSVCLYLSICLSVCLSISGNLSVCISGNLSVCLSVFLSICLSVYLSICLSVCLSFCPSVCLFVCLFVCLLFGVVTIA